MSWLFLLKILHSKVVGYDGGMLGNNDVRQKACNWLKMLDFLMILMCYIFWYWVAWKDFGCCSGGVCR